MLNFSSFARTIPEQKANLRGFARYVRASRRWGYNRTPRHWRQDIWRCWEEYLLLPPRMRCLFDEMEQAGCNPLIRWDGWGRPNRIDFSPGRRK